MKSLYCLSIYLIFFSVLYSQSYSGRVTDKKSGEPISYVNIGIKSQNIGTVSNRDGVFLLKLDNKYDRDSLYISCIGYNRAACLISEFKDLFNTTGQVSIELQPKIYRMDEVVVRPIDDKVYTLGYFCDPNSAYGNAFYSEELGTEIGAVIKLPDGRKTAYLQSFRFVAGKFTFDYFPLRLNVYELVNGKPGKNILMEPVLIEITYPGEYVIELEKYKIKTNGDFFISLEYYRTADQRDGELIFCAVEKENDCESYYRLTSQGSWLPEMVANTGFSVQVKCEE